jgi:pyruvate/2-oxoglutarate dehydrogenase complex dihydrolipoamide acyltransferase (E2) component
MSDPDFPSKLTYREEPWPVLRNVIIDFLSLRRPHTVYGFGEVDITHVLQRIGTVRRQTRVAISLNTCLLHCLALAIREHPSMHAYRWGNRLLFPDRVDIGTVIEKHLPDGMRIPVGYVVRGADRKGIAAIQQELRAAMRAPGLNNGAAARQRRAIAHLPTWLRRCIWWWIRRSPLPFWESRGTVGLTNPQAPGFRRPLHFTAPTPYTFTLQVGGQYRRAELAPDGSVVQKTYLCLTAAMDHDIVDGMTMLRFARRFAELLETGAGLEEHRPDTFHAMAAEANQDSADTAERSAA